MSYPVSTPTFCLRSQGPTVTNDQDAMGTKALGTGTPEDTSLPTTAMLGCRSRMTWYGKANGWEKRHDTIWYDMM